MRHPLIIVAIWLLWAAGPAVAQTKDGQRARIRDLVNTTDSDAGSIVGTGRWCA